MATFMLRVGFLLATTGGTVGFSAPETHKLMSQARNLQEEGTAGAPHTGLRGAVSMSPPAGHALVDARVLLCLAAGLALTVLGSIQSKGKTSAFAVVGFMMCSSMMLIMNKLAITCLPYPMLVLAAQLLSCGLGVRVASLIGLIEVEGLKFDKVRQFGVTPIAFLATLAANIKILEFANVETFIMVRNATPLATSVLDWMFLGRELPNRQSVLMLGVALLGSVGYVYADNGFLLQAYFWAAAWLMIFLFDQVYIKYIISTVPMNNWTRVYYNNMVAGIFALLYVIVYENSFMALVDGWKGDPFQGVLVLALSCIMGTAMSYFAFAARDALSATSFTIVGNVCKVLSVFANVMIWDKHASADGLSWLALVVVSAGMYKQAPMREKKEALPTKA